MATDLLVDELDDLLREHGPSRVVLTEEARIRVRHAHARGVLTSDEARALLDQLADLDEAA